MSALADYVELVRPLLIALIILGMVYMTWYWITNGQPPLWTGMTLSEIVEAVR